jgi:hypothetical protein
VVTLAASVPAHRDLGHGFDPAVHARLLATNWVRTRTPRRAPHRRRLPRPR